jgi:small subunit ribosomal protein S9
MSDTVPTVDAPEAPAKQRSIFVGRRKSAVARARVRRGAGQVVVNGRPLEEYFTTEKLRSHVLEPFAVLEQEGQWDVTARIEGGGTTGQAGALRLAIARALTAEDASWRAPLKSAGLLTRDARKVERKKYGLKKARRAPQFSKR